MNGDHAIGLVTCARMGYEITDIEDRRRIAPIYLDGKKSQAKQFMEAAHNQMIQQDPLSSQSMK